MVIVITLPFFIHPLVIYWEQGYVTFKLALTGPGGFGLLQAQEGLAWWEELRRTDLTWGVGEKTENHEHRCVVGCRARGKKEGSVFNWIFVSEFLILQCYPHVFLFLGQLECCRQEPLTNVVSSTQLTWCDLSLAPLTPVSLEHFAARSFEFWGIP